MTLPPFFPSLLNWPWWSPKRCSKWVCNFYWRGLFWARVWKMNPRSGESLGKHIWFTVINCQLLVPEFVPLLWFPEPFQKSLQCDLRQASIRRKIRYGRKISNFVYHGKCTIRIDYLAPPLSPLPCPASSWHAKTNV